MINNAMTRRGLLGLAGAGLLAGMVAAPAETAEAAVFRFRQWNRSTVYVWSTISSAWYVGSAVEEWDDSSRLDLVTTYRQPDPASSIIRIKYGTPLSGARASCDCDYDGLGRIKSAVITVSKKMNLSVWSKELRVALMRHEVGHALGFDHSSTGRDVMYGKTLGPMNLSQFHRDRLRLVYGS